MHIWQHSFLKHIFCVLLQWIQLKALKHPTWRRKWESRSHLASSNITSDTSKVERYGVDKHRQTTSWLSTVEERWSDQGGSQSRILSLPWSPNRELHVTDHPISPLTPVSPNSVSVPFHPCHHLLLLFSPFFSFPPLFVGRLHFYLRFLSSFWTCAAFALSLTGRAAVHDTYPAESSRAGSMDCSTLRGGDT